MQDAVARIESATRYFAVMPALVAGVPSTICARATPASYEACREVNTLALSARPRGSGDPVLQYDITV